MAMLEWAVWCSLLATADTCSAESAAALLHVSAAEAAVSVVTVQPESGLRFRPNFTHRPCRWTTMGVSSSRASRPSAAGRPSPAAASQPSGGSWLAVSVFCATQTSICVAWTPFVMSTRIPNVLAMAESASLPAEYSGDFRCVAVQGEGQDGGRGADDQEQRHRQVRFALHEPNSGWL